MVGLKLVRWFRPATANPAEAESGTRNAWCKFCKKTIDGQLDNYCPSCGEPLTDLPVDRNTRNYIITLTKETLSDLTNDKEIVVREISDEATQKAFSTIKIWSAIIGIPIAAIITFGAIEGIKDARDFFHSVEPAINKAQSEVADIEPKIKTDQEDLQNNEHSLNKMRSQIGDQQNQLNTYSGELGKLQPQIATLQEQLKSLSQQTTTIVARHSESRLEQDFPSYNTGKVTLTLNGEAYQTPADKTASNVIVYLTSSVNLLSGHSMDEIRNFAAGLSKQGYKFVHGNFALQSGSNTTGGNIVPYAFCTQIVYYDTRYEAAANQVAALVASSFNLPILKPKLLNLNSVGLFDSVSKTVVNESGINIAASVTIPEAPGCAQILSTSEQ